MNIRNSLEDTHSNREEIGFVGIVVFNFISHLLQFLWRGILLWKLKTLRTEKWVC